jgi:hypothetical protein
MRRRGTSYSTRYAAGRGGFVVRPEAGAGHLGAWGRRFREALPFLLGAWGLGLGARNP